MLIWIKAPKVIWMWMLMVKEFIRPNWIQAKLRADELKDKGDGDGKGWMPKFEFCGKSRLDVDVKVKDY